jgi:3-oxoacyl-(acyl-carrier-protein) synthase
VGGPRVFVVGRGLIAPGCRNVAEALDLVRAGRSALTPLDLFPSPTDPPCPVGQVRDLPASDLPRAHALALTAATEALAGSPKPPDAVVVGVTTGGMPATETLLREGETRPEAYRFHGAGTVAEEIARRVGCIGPALTVSTACSGGAVALAAALELIRSGRARRVLAGGADALCRLTVHGFHSLQLIDPEGARPFDERRGGMSVGEGAAFLLLEGAIEPPPGALAELAGAGLSCDAHHATAPHPEGAGALAAMRAALADAGIGADGVDYVNLHGTGTRENDAAEARALAALFADATPPLSSTKGVFGHPLAAAGATGAVLATLALTGGVLPANVGCHAPDPALGVAPIVKPQAATPRAVLVNAFGFGGNNAALVLTRTDRSASPAARRAPSAWTVAGSSCLTARGDRDGTLAALARGESCVGAWPDDALARAVPARFVRRLARLPRLALALGIAAQVEADGRAANGIVPRSVFLGTGWGPLTETHDFLKKLFDSGERFGSAIEFAGSVHNSPAAQTALWFAAKGANVTATGGDSSFEQALLLADLLAGDDGPVLLIGADEAHARFTPLFDASAARRSPLSDGGAAFFLSRGPGSGPRLTLLHYGAGDVERLVGDVGPRVGERFGAILVGLPAATRGTGETQLAAFLGRAGVRLPVIDYRTVLGEYATVSATATAIAVRWVRDGNIPAAPADGSGVDLGRRGVLVLGLGRALTAVAVEP